MHHPRPELPECLKTALGLRMPVFRREPHPDAASPAERIRQMEEYIQITGYWEGELNEERVKWLADKEPLRREWGEIPESEWGHLRRTRTETAVDQAKRQVRPELYTKIQDCDWMVKRLTEEVGRMGREYDRASRVYSLITGS